MKLEINTTTKEIKILEDVNLAEFLTEIQVLDLNINEYNIIPNNNIQQYWPGLYISSGIYNPIHTEIMCGTSGEYTLGSLNSSTIPTL